MKGIVLTISVIYNFQPCMPEDHCVDGDNGANGGGICMLCEQNVDQRLFLFLVHLPSLPTSSCHPRHI